MKPIADTGVIVGLLASDDPYHQWAADAFRKFAPFFTCEAVLAEAASFFRSPHPVLTLVARGDLVLDFSLKDEIGRALALVAKYEDQPRDLADACVVRMTELNTRCKVWTLDKADFTVYRQAWPTSYPLRLST